MSRKRWLLVVLVFAGLFLWCFAEALFCDRMFAWRDAAHFYYPLFQFIQDQWSAGQLPLWNPYENAGAGLLADPAGSVFYPGKLIFFLPIDYAWAYKIYIAAHVVLAAWLAFRAARHFDASLEAATIAGMSYAFSGAVLLQHANVIYLVGASWLPAAVIAADQMLSERRMRRALALGAVLALMVLGGDPQMAYNTVLLVALYALLLRGQNNHSRGRKPADRVASRHFVLLAMATAFALILSAVQVIPSVMMIHQSNRAASQTARSVWEIPRVLGREHAGRRIADGLLCRDVDESAHHRHVYQFSVGPWRWAEWFWPNCGGRQYPIHRRWFAAIPAEGRVWTPSLYMGLLPLVLALSSVRLCRGSALRRWLSWSALVAVLGSLGYYGLGWLVHELRAAAGAPPEAGLLAGPVGGLYWLLTVLLPGYVYFRYPAKLLVVATLALSLLAAQGWDRAMQRSGGWLRRGLLMLCCVSLLGAAITMAVRPWWTGWFAHVDPDRLLGPLDAAGALDDLLFGFVQAAVVAGVAWWLLGRMGATGVSPVPSEHQALGQRCAMAQPPCRWAPVALVVLIAVDLGLANGWMVATAPARLWREPSALAATIRSDQARRRGAMGGLSALAADKSAAADKLPLAPEGLLRKASPRVWRPVVLMPEAWQRHGSPDRLAQAIAWDRDTLRPKYNLRERIGVVESHGAMMPAAHRRLLAQGDPTAIMRATGARYAILPAGQTLPGGELVAEFGDDAALWYWPGQ